VIGIGADQMDRHGKPLKLRHCRGGRAIISGGGANEFEARERRGKFERHDEAPRLRENGPAAVPAHENNLGDQPLGRREHKKNLATTSQNVRIEFILIGPANSRPNQRVTISLAVAIFLDRCGAAFGNCRAARL
jgi:hypothetical protein